MIATLKRYALLAAALFFAVSAVTARAEDHRAYKDSTLGDCKDCHEGSGVVDFHNGPDWLAQHRLLAQKSTANCTSCHQQSFCLDCHNGGNVTSDGQKSVSRRGESMPTTHEADFISIHPMKARDDPQSCYRCHETQFCQDCHSRWQAKALPFNVINHGPTYVTGGIPDPNWVSQHRSEAKRNLRSCQACHPAKSDCSNATCHVGQGGR